MELSSSLVVCVAVLWAGGAGAQDKEPAETKVSKAALPAAVLKAFKAAYPAAEMKGASKESENGQTFYEIESVDKGTKRDLLFTPEGALVEIEEEIAPGAVPPAVMAAIKARYPQARLTKHEKLTKGQEISYEFEVKGAAVKEFLLAPDGTWLKPKQ